MKANGIVPLNRIKFVSRLLFVILLLLIFNGCFSNIPNDWKILDVGPFKITTPPSWDFKDPGVQEDSFIGQIIGPHAMFSFDYSDMGYANNLLSTEKEYLDGRGWMRECYFCKSGINYSGAIPDYEAKTKIHLPTQQQKIKFPKADYIADLTLKDSTVYVPIELPAEIKNQIIQVDSNSKYVFKTIWPKISGKGMTGIYIHSRSSSMNFQMNARDLSTEDQKFALQTFKTIELKSK